MREPPAIARIRVTLWRCRPLAVGAIAACAGAAWAAAPGGRGTSHAPVGGGTPDAIADTVTVTATRTIPKVQSTFPALGAQVKPGLLVLRVTFSDRMREDGWSYVPSQKGQYPDCAESPRLLDDKRTFVLICRTLPSKTYGVWFNRAPLVDFSNHGGRSATPYELTFTTTDDDPIRTLPEAMKADKALSTLSNPVEPTGLAAIGEPHVPPQ